MSLDSHEAVAQGLDGDVQLAGRPVLSETGTRMLDELEHPDPEASTPGTEDYAQRGGRLALALAGVDYDQSVTNAAALGQQSGLFTGILLAHESPSLLRPLLHSPWSGNPSWYYIGG